jgi:hypothetical protein
MKHIIREINACTHIIGRILEENLNFTIILKINVKTGVLDLTSIIIEKVALMNIIVRTVMDGKSKNIIQKIIN